MKVLSINGNSYFVTIKVEIDEDNGTSVYFKTVNYLIKLLENEIVLIDNNHRTTRCIF